MDDGRPYAPALRCTRVHKDFGSFRAVRDVSLEVPPGEIFALLGPNGAGKTTLIHCIAGLSRPTSGAIEVFGHDTIRDFRTTRRLLGLVSQEIVFDPFFTPFESLMIQMGLMGVRPDARWADELLGRFALSQHRNAYARHLSGGMKRRLLVAKALVHRPKLVFLDEPTAGVDVELRKELWNEVRRLRAEGTTIILTTHYLEEAEQLADRIGVIHRGAIQLVEDRTALMQRHRTNRVIFTVTDPPASLPPALAPSLQRVDASHFSTTWSTTEELEKLLGAVRTYLTVTDLHFEHSRLEDIFVDIISSAEEKAPA